MSDTGRWYVAYRAEGRLSRVEIDAFDDRGRAMAAYNSMKMCRGEVCPPHYGTDDTAAKAFLTGLLAGTGNCSDDHKPE